MAFVNEKGIVCRSQLANSGRNCNTSPYLDYFRPKWDREILHIPFTRISIPAALRHKYEGKKIMIVLIVLPDSVRE